MAAKPISDNTLFYGDNLPILREYVPDKSVDLIYLDPPFNSNRSYNVLFKDEGGAESESQITAFDDSWHWGPSTERLYRELVEEGPERVARVMGALRGLVGPNQIGAYLVMMTARLVELHRVLKASGSLYLHCDPTASHYLKIVMDAVFGPNQFRNEIAWKRTSAHSDAKQGNVVHMGRVHDVILFYTKSDAAARTELHQPYSEQYLNNFYRYSDPDGRRYRLDNLTGPGGAAKGNPQYELLGITRYWRYSKPKMEALYQEGRVVQTKPGAVPAYKRYLDEMPGVPLQDVWDDILPVQSQARERLGYPTQKPLALLERIIQASSNPGDLVLDPFCGCGTAIVAAEKLGRKWIGIDITHLAIALNKYRLRDMFAEVEFKVIGEPQDVGGALQLATEDRYQFQWWALSLVQAKPVGGDGGKRGKKGSDTGIDGVITFLDNDKEKVQRVLVQVKSGDVKSGDLRDLRGVVEREGAAVGVLICLEPTTSAMEREAVLAGVYTSAGWNRDYPRLQILTIEQLLEGRKVEMPGRQVTFKQGERATQKGANQAGLGLR